jgi:hypothetical protein
MEESKDGNTSNNNNRKKEPIWKKKKKKAHRKKINSIHDREMVAKEPINFFVSPNIQHPDQRTPEGGEPEYVIQIL